MRGSRPLCAGTPHAARGVVVPFAVAAVWWATLFGSPATARAADELLTVAVDVRRLDDAAYRRYGLLALARKVALRLTQAGYAVVAPERRPHVRVEVGLLGGGRGGLSLRARARGISAERREVPRGAAKLEQYHLEVVHKAVEAVRVAARRYRAWRAKQPRRQLGGGERPPGTRGASGLAGGGGSADRRGLSLALVGGALYRPGGADAMARLGLRWGARSSGLLLVAMLTAAPSFDADLTVVEWGAQLGAGWAFALGKRLRLDVALLAGVSLHHFAIDGASVPSGVRVDLQAHLSAELLWRLGQRLGLGLWVAPGLSEQGREHRRDGARVWQRSAFRLEAGAVLRWTL